MERRASSRREPSPGNFPQDRVANYALCIEEMTIPTLTSQLTQSLRRPTRRTLTLINKALHYLTPFEQAAAHAISPYERQALLDMIHIHRLTLCPYMDLDRIESNLRHGKAV